MPTIVTLTPNPSIDLLFQTTRLVWDDANRVESPRRRAGGQGVNVVRALRELGHALKSTYTTVVLLSPTLVMPPEIEKEVSVLDLPLPDYRDLVQLLKEIVGVVREGKSATVELTREDADHLVRRVALALGREALQVAEEDREDLLLAPQLEPRGILEQLLDDHRRHVLTEHRLHPAALALLGELAPTADERPRGTATTQRP